MGQQLSNRELLSQISNGRLDETEAGELLRLNRKFSYYRNVSQMLNSIYKRNPVKVIDSDDYAREVQQQLTNSILRIGRDVETPQAEEDYGRLIELLAQLGGDDYIELEGVGY